MKNLLYFYLLSLLIVVAALNATAKSIVTDGLVSYWTFEKHTILGKKVEDKWGDNDVTIEGNPNIVPGYLDDALEFDGTDDYINLTSLGDFGEHVGTSTFEAWVKVEHKAGAMTLFDVQDECMKWGLNFITNDKGKNDGIEHISGIINKVDEELPIDLCQSFWEFLITPNVTDGRWHHIAYTANIVDRNRLGVRKFQQLRIYIDTKQVNRGSLRAIFSPKFISFINPVYLGAANNKGVVTKFFKGTIDEVRLYNRPLTADEVTQNYNSKVGLSVEPDDKLSIIWGKLKSTI